MSEPISTPMTRAKTRPKTRPKKIVLFTLADITLSTADAVTSIRTAAYLVRAGHAVTLIAPRQARNVPTIPADGVELRFHLNLCRFGFPNAFNAVIQWIWSWRLCWTGNTDLFYVRASMFSFLFGLRRRCCVGPAVFSEHHGWFETERQSGSRFRWFARFERSLQMLDVKLADRVRTVVPGIRDLFIQHGAGASKVAVIGNACDVEHVVPVERAQALRSQRLSEDRRYLGYLGSLTEWQGLPVVLDAMAEIVRRDSGIDLLIVGDGPLNAELRQQAQRLGLGERVRFLGRCQQDEIVNILGCFDLALLPTGSSGYSRIGRSPLKLREYAAAGKSILAAAIPSITDLAAQPWLSTYPLGDASALADSAIAILNDSSELQRKVALARSFAETEFSWPAVTRAVCAELENM